MFAWPQYAQSFLQTNIYFFLLKQKPSHYNFSIWDVIIKEQTGHSDKRNFYRPGKFKPAAPAQTFWNLVDFFLSLASLNFDGKVLRRSDWESEASNAEATTLTIKLSEQRLIIVERSYKKKEEKQIKENNNSEIKNE